MINAVLVIQLFNSIRYATVRLPKYFSNFYRTPGLWEGDRCGDGVNHFALLPRQKPRPNTHNPPTTVRKTGLQSMLQFSG
jgi:hypothetical protein